MEQKIKSTDLKADDIIAVNSIKGPFFRVTNLVGTDNPDRYDILVKKSDKEGNLDLSDKQQYRITTTGDETIYIFNRIASTEETQSPAMLTKVTEALNRWLTRTPCA